MVRNFLFHRVNPKREKLWDPMDVQLFDKCITYIRKHYEIELLEDLVEKGNATGKDNYATIMFDDGYKDNIEYAAEILSKHKCKASFYVVTDCIDKNIPTWTHTLEHLFQNTHIDNLNLPFDFLPDDLKITQLKTEADRLNYVSKIKPFLKTLTHEKRNLVLDKIILTYKDVELPKLMMSWDDLSELKNSGHYIGSHSVSHCMFGTMTNEAEIKYELETSAQIIKNKLGHFPKTISYPVGSYTETTKKLSKEAGYIIGLAVKQQIYNPEKDDVFEIPRIELYNEPWWKTRLRITNTLENIKSIIGYK